MNFTLDNIFSCEKELEKFLKQFSGRPGVYMISGVERINYDDDVCRSSDTNTSVCYIGQSKDLSKRLHDHLKTYRKKERLTRSISEFFNYCDALGMEYKLTILELPEAPYCKILTIYKECYYLQEMETYWMQQYDSKGYIVKGIGKNNNMNRNNRCYSQMRGSIIKSYYKKYTNAKYIKPKRVRQLTKEPKFTTKAALIAHIRTKLSVQNPFTTSNIVKKPESVPALLRPVSQDQPNPFVNPTAFKQQRIVATVISVPEEPVKPERRISPNPFTNPSGFKAQLMEVRRAERKSEWKKPAIDPQYFDFLDDFTKISPKTT